MSPNNVAHNNAPGVAAGPAPDDFLVRINPFILGAGLVAFFLFASLVAFASFRMTTLWLAVPDLEPLRMPLPAAEAVSAESEHPAPALTGCPAVGGCPEINVVVLYQEWRAFQRHLELAALNHGGDYERRGRLYYPEYAIQLPPAAAAELRALHTDDFRKEFLTGRFERFLSDSGYQRWARKWSTKRTDAAATYGAGALETLYVTVTPLGSSYYRYGPILLGLALLPLAGIVSLPVLFFIERRRQNNGAIGGAI